MERTLKFYFGYERFKPLQEEVIKSVLDGKDAFVLMPTGGGKSLCYQLPALQLQGLTLVVSPLIALMKDQVDALNSNGIPAEFINSSLSNLDIINIQFKVFQGEIKLLYVAPERLTQNSFKEFLKSLNLSLIAIDEAHCISEWGHDFRPDYRALKDLKKLFPNVPTIALTATATTKVREDIVKELDLKEPKIFISSFDRENLNLFVVRKKNSFDKILEILKEHKGESTIIYCYSRKETEKLVSDLNKKGYKAIFYHAGLEDKIRKKNQEMFINDDVNIIVATIAFGMGIDKSNVRLVIHQTFPKTLEGYYQEIGRAGRDGLKSDCILFYSIADKRKHDFFIDKIQDSKIKINKKEKLKEIIDYCESKICRKKYILNYFGEDMDGGSCDNCDVCLSPKELLDITEIAKNILSCIKLTNSYFGINYIIKVLRGSKSVKDWHKEYFVFNSCNESEEELKEIIEHLINQEFIKKSDGDYPTLSLTFKGIDFLQAPEKIELSVHKRDIKSVKTETRDELDYDRALFEKLRDLRKRLADERKVPPFIIFGDVSLREMAHYKPKIKEDFSRIKGVGEAKLESFGEFFMEVIREYES